MDKELLDEFCNKNTALWKKADSKKYVYVNLTMVRMQVAWIVPKLIYARGVADKNDANIIVIIWNRNEELEQIVKSYGAELFVINEECKKHLLSLCLLTVKIACFLSIFNNGYSIQRIKYRKLSVGKEIYEDILRTSNLSTIKKANMRICIKKTVHILSAIKVLDMLLKKKSPICSIHDDVAYHEGAFEKLIRTYGAKLVRVNNYKHYDIKFDDEGEIVRDRTYQQAIIKNRLKKIDDSVVKWVDQYLIDRFDGLNGREIDRDAFLNKEEISRQIISKNLGLDFQKRNVVIMAHTFSDAVFNQGHIFYKDYYDWLEDTLKYISHIKTVNWILKPHPSRKIYNEEKDSIEALFQKYKSDNMFILSDDIGGKTVRLLADSMITIGSNAGAEYSCFGIPVVLVGKPYYYGHGYTIDTTSIEEYHHTLDNINAIERLKDSSVLIAKKVFYCYYNEENTDQSFCDEFVEVCNRSHKKMHEEMASQYFMNDEGTEEYNEQTVKDILKYISEKDIKYTEYYEKANI